MPTQENGRPLDPTSRRSPVGERVHIDEVIGGSAGVTSLPQLTDVDNALTPAKGSIMVGNGSVYAEQVAGLDGQVLVYDSSQPRGVRAAAGLDPAAHEALDTLAHEIVEESYDEATYSAGKIQTFITWETSAKLKKVREQQFTYTGSQVTTHVFIQYDGAGAELYRLTETIAWAGGKVQNITRVRT